jgi:hypothetical protein
LDVLSGRRRNAQAAARKVKHGQATSRIASGFAKALMQSQGKGGARRLRLRRGVNISTGRGKWTQPAPNHADAVEWLSKASGATDRKLPER